MRDENFLAHRILPSHKASRIASYHRASHPTIAQSIAHRILPSRIASYRRTKHRASHPTIAHRILPSHDFSRLHAWSFSAIIRTSQLPSGRVIIPLFAAAFISKKNILLVVQSCSVSRSYRCFFVRVLNIRDGTREFYRWICLEVPRKRYRGIRWYLFDMLGKWKTLFYQFPRRSA